MAHFLAQGGVVLVVWTVAVLPLAVAIGRRLGRAGRTTTKTPRGSR